MTRAQLKRLCFMSMKNQIFAKVRLKVSPIPYLEELDEGFSSFSCGGKHMKQSVLFTSVKQLVRESMLCCMRLKKVLFLLFGTA